MNVFLILRLALIVIFFLLFLALSAAISGASGENARAAVVLVVEIDGPGVQEARTLFARAHVAWIRVLIPDVRNSELCVGEGFRIGWNPMTVNVLGFRQDVVNDPIPHEG